MAEILSQKIKSRSDDGKEITIFEYTTSVLHQALSGRSPRLKGSRRYALDDGASVNCIDENTFQVVQTDQILRKI